MKGLTLTAPWAWAVAHARKDVENRKTRCPSILGQRIAIHAGRSPGAQDAEEWAASFRWMRERGLIHHLPTVAECQPSAIVAVATVIGWYREDGDNDGATTTFTAAEMFAAEFKAHRGLWSPWFTGPFGWLLHDVRTLATPIPCRGKQGLWNVPPGVEAAIMEVS